jgi:hypothetical protein
MRLLSWLIGAALVTGNRLLRMGGGWRCARPISGGTWKFLTTIVGVDSSYMRLTRCRGTGRNPMIHKTDFKLAQNSLSSLLRSGPAPGL